MTALGPIHADASLPPIPAIRLEVPGLAYFTAPKLPVERCRKLSALDQMYAYFGSDLE